MVQKYIDAARIVGKKNLDGRLTVKNAASLPFCLREGMRVSLVPPAIDIPRNVVVEGVWSEGEGSHVVSFDSVSDADVAERLIGCHCLVLAADVPPELSESLAFAEELACASGFLGWTIVDRTSGKTGEVVDVSELPSQVMLTVKLDEDASSHLVPLVDDFDIDADESQRTIAASLPEGIFDI